DAAARRHPQWRAHLGVPAPVRWRRAAVDQRDVTGHGDRGAHAREQGEHGPGQLVRSRQLSVGGSPGAGHPPAGAPAGRGGTGIPRDPLPAYSYNPNELVINGFLQTLIGLWDYWHASGDTTARALFKAASPQAQYELPSYDTGAWSLCEPGQEDT